MPDEKFSQLPAATTPLDGSEIVPIVQGGQNRKTTSAELGAGGGGGTPIFTPSAQGSVPASGGGTANFIRADGTWGVPPGTGGTQFTPSTAGIVPASGGGTTKFVRADGTWQVPPGNPTSLAVGSTPITGGTSGNFQINTSGVLSENTPTQVTAALNLFTNVLRGLVPGSGGGTTNFLRADATWAAPAGGTGTGWPNTISVADFGATGNGSTDDTVALNNAYASVAGSHALVLWPAGTYKVTNTINCGNGTGGDAASISFISTVCPAGLDGTTLQWLGPNDGRPAFRNAGNKYAILKGLTINNATGSRGSSLGYQLGGRGTPTSNSNANYTQAIDVDQLRITNFHVGVSDGNFGAASELTFRHLAVSGCDTGVTFNVSNSLNIVFIMLGMTSNGIGLDTGGGLGYLVLNSSLGQNTTCDFFVQQNCLNLTIINARSEAQVGGNFVQGTTNAGSVQLYGCIQSGGSVPDRAISGTFQDLTIRDCYFNTWIAPTKVQRITIQNTHCPIHPSSRLPALLSTDNSTDIQCNFMSNSNVSSVPVDDFIGYARDINYTGSPFTNSAFFASYVKRQQQILAPNTGAPYGGDYTTLSFVRQLAEGPTPGTFLPTSQTLVTTGAPTSGPTLTFASVPSSIVPYMIVSNDTNPGSLFVGTRVQTTTATTVTIGGTSSPVNTGDVIRFWNPGGNTAPGNNLRVSATFPGGGTTVSVLFTRTISYTYSGRRLTATSGRFYPTDVGKPVKLVGVTAPPATWTDLFGYISLYIDSTHVEYSVYPGSPNSASGSTAGGLVIGQDEPDANYVVLGVTSDDATPKSFSVSSILATGFTITASAVTSANVSALIVR